MAMTCKEFRSRGADFDDYATAADRERFDAHAEECDECAYLRRAFRGTRALFLATHEPVPGAHGRLRQPTEQAVAAFLASRRQPRTARRRQISMRWAWAVGGGALAFAAIVGLLVVGLSHMVRTAPADMPAADAAMSATVLSDSHIALIDSADAQGRVAVVEEPVVAVLVDAQWSSLVAWAEPALLATTTRPAPTGGELAIVRIQASTSDEAAAANQVATQMLREISAPLLAEACGGVVAAWPPITLDWRRESPALRVFPFGTGVDAGVRIVALGPYGEWHCGNHGPGAGARGAGLTIESPLPGVYSVWLSAAEGGDVELECMVVTELEYASALQWPGGCG